MAVNLSPYGGVGAQFLDNSGNVLTGGKIFTYSAGTTTNQVTYTTSAGNIPHSNPIILDASGRVPSGGEIWLTDGFSYKFILRDANDVLIATYDNVTGINSNFVAFTNQQEIQTATAGQTVFNLATITYQPATNSLTVFVDGVNQYGPGAQYAYLETDGDTVTFVNGLHVGAEVKFTTSQLNSSASQSDAFQVSYTPPFTGSVATSVGNKLAQTVSVMDFGAVGDGVTDDTTAIQNALDYVKNIGGGEVYLPAGTYKCDSQLTLTSANGVRILGASKNILRTGSTIINYTGTASPFITISGTSCGIENTNIFYTSVSFVGTLVKMTAYGSFLKDCFLSGENIKNTSLYLLDLDTVVDAEIVNTFFGGSQYAIRGIADGGLTESNVVFLNKCTFNGQTVSCIRNLGQAWSIVNCTFQQISDLTGSAISMHSACFARGTSISGCWFGDATAAGAWAWIEWQGQGLSVTGCYINGTGFKTADAIRIIGTSNSVSITGNRMQAFLNNVNIGAFYLSESSIVGNANNTSINQIAGTPAGAILTYKENTWTPDFTGLTVVGAATYTGFYEKIGSVVKFTAVITPTGAGTTAVTSYAGAYINNLPFASISGSLGYDVCSVLDINTPASLGQAPIAPNSTNCFLPNWTPRNTVIIISGSYTSFAIA
jgi:hypothetical protein